MNDTVLVDPGDSIPVSTCMDISRNVQVEVPLEHTKIDSPEDGASYVSNSKESTDARAVTLVQEPQIMVYSTHLYVLNDKVLFDLGDSIPVSTCMDNSGNGQEEVHLPLEHTKIDSTDVDAASYVSK